MRPLMFLALTVLTGALSGYTLDELIAATKLHPAVERYAEEVSALTAKSDVERSWYDPFIGIGLIRNTMLYEDKYGNLRPSVMIEQMFPWPGKKSLAGDILLRQADGVTAMRDGEFRGRIATLKNDFYALYAVRREEALLEKSREWVAALIATAEGLAAAGSAGMLDAVMAKGELTMLDEERIMLAARGRSLTVLILTRDAGLTEEAEITVPDEIVPPPQIPLDEAQDKALAAAPMLAVRQADITMRKAEQELAAKEAYPDFKVGVEFMDPGAWSITAGVSVPIFYQSKQRRLSDSADRSLAASALDLSDEKLRITAMVTDRWYMADGLRAATELYRTRVLPERELARDTALASYRSAQGTLADVIATARQLIEAHRRLVRLESDHLAALAAIEELTGGNP